MNKSDSIIKIIPALLKAQKEIGGVSRDNTAKVKTKSGAEFSYTYADLPSVIDACKESLNKNGITVLQPVCGDMVETYLIHETGEWISDGGVKILSEYPNDPQKQGSAITYSRRYGLQSFLLIPAEDDDGNSTKKDVTAQIAPKAPTVNQPTTPPAPRTVKCPLCFAVSGYHKPGCNNAPKSNEDQLGGY